MRRTATRWDKSAPVPLGVREPTISFHEPTLPAVSEGTDQEFPTDDPDTLPGSSVIVVVPHALVALRPWPSGLKRG